MRSNERANPAPPTNDNTPARHSDPTPSPRATNHKIEDPNFAFSRDFILLLRPATAPLTRYIATNTTLIVLEGAHRARDRVRHVP